jgi:hypothetical protein
MKQTVNATVLAVTTDQALYCCVAIFPSSQLQNDYLFTFELAAV